MFDVFTFEFLYNCIGLLLVLKKLNYSSSIFVMLQRNIICLGVNFYLYTSL